MYPLLLKPAVKDYLWGGTRLKTEYNYETNKEIAAEAWVLSCHKDGADTVANGSLAGKTLAEAIELWGDKAIGEKAAAFPYFPLLIKLIDAKDRLKPLKKGDFSNRLGRKQWQNQCSKLIFGNSPQFS